LLRRLQQGTGGRKHTTELLQARPDAGRPEVARALLKLLEDKDAETRNAALLALGSIGPVTAEVLPALWKAVQTEDKRGGPTFALRAIRRLSPTQRAPLAEDILKLIRSPAIDNAMWREAMLILPGHFDQAPTLILDILRATLRIRDLWALGTALEVAAGIGPAAGELLDDLLAALEKEILLHGELTAALARVEPEGERALPGLRRLLGSSHPHTRFNALRGLMYFGGRARPQVGEVEPLVNDPDSSWVRPQAVETLRAIRTE
jgi:HEAT repeat protein